MSGDIADRNSVEILQRAKRIETKVSRLMERMGFVDEAGDRPTWEDGSVRIPSMEVAFKEILAVIPKKWDAQVLIVHQRQTLATIKPMP